MWYKKGLSFSFFIEDVLFLCYFKSLLRWHRRNPKIFYIWN